MTSFSLHKERPYEKPDNSIVLKKKQLLQETPRNENRCLIGLSSLHSITRRFKMTGGTILPGDGRRLGLLEETPKIDLDGTEEFGFTMAKQGREEHVQLPLGSTPSENPFGHGIRRIKVEIEGAFFVRIPQQYIDRLGGTI